MQLTLDSIGARYRKQTRSLELQRARAFSREGVCVSHESDQLLSARAARMERLLEAVSYEATEQNRTTVNVDAKYVDDHLGNLVKDEDLSRYIL